jgi:pimeloyl-ACP methyl ester carboxylesterase
VSSRPAVDAHESFVVADDGTQLYLRARGAGGAGDVLSLLCDGIACDGFIWKYLWDALSPVAHWHYRGHGRSQSPVDPQRIGVEDLARDADAVRLALGDPEVVMFGHSMGCQVVLENYRIHPRKVRAMVLLCGSPGRVTHTFKGTDALAQVLPRMIDVVERHPNLARGIWGRVPPELALRAAFALGEVDAKAMSPQDLLPYLQHMVDIDLPMFLRMLRAAGEHTAEDLLSRIEVPVLIVAADRDSFTPTRLAEQMAASIPKGELLLVSGTHAAPLEQKELVGDAIQAFLAKALAPSAREAAIGDEDLTVVPG